MLNLLLHFQIFLQLCRHCHRHHFCLWSGRTRNGVQPQLRSLQSAIQNAALSTGSQDLQDKRRSTEHNEYPIDSAVQGWMESQLARKYAEEREQENSSTTVVTLKTMLEGIQREPEPELRQKSQTRLMSALDSWISFSDDVDESIHKATQRAIENTSIENRYW